jgi:hypothetical protein
VILLLGYHAGIWGLVVADLLVLLTTQVMLIGDSETTGNLTGIWGMPVGWCTGLLIHGTGIAAVTCWGGCCLRGWEVD